MCWVIFKALEALFTCSCLRDSKDKDDDGQPKKGPAVVSSQPQQQKVPEYQQNHGGGWR